MNKTKDTGYLFAKMTSLDENGVGHIMVSDNADTKAPIPPTRTFHFDEKASEKQSYKKWILDNVMLLVTLSGVLVGVVTGTFIKLDETTACDCDTLYRKGKKEDKLK